MICLFDNKWELKMKVRTESARQLRLNKDTEITLLTDFI